MRQTEGGGDFSAIPVAAELSGPRASQSSSGPSPGPHKLLPKTRTSGYSRSTTLTGSRPTVKHPSIRTTQRLKEISVPKVKQIPKWVSIPRAMVESRPMVGLTMILTVYALIGDDMRLIFTSQPADSVFDAITLFCICVFTLEVLLSCLGKDDYFLGFFFYLDIVSTTTLLFDLTVVNDLMQGDEEDVGSLQESKTALVGARTARVVRVLRLVRILKLYKTLYEARQAKRRRDKKADMLGEDAFWEEFDEGDISIEDLQRESRVGKKLSDLTTRRVICLVLAMMLVLPLLQIDVSQQMPFSGVFGADVVHDAFHELEADPTNQESKKTYQVAMLRYLYYHNWYMSREKCPNSGSKDHICPDAFFSFVYWVGIVYNPSELLPDALAQKAALASVSAQAVANFERDFVNDSLIFNYGSMPPEIQTIIGSPWTADCPASSGTIHRLGFSVLAVPISGVNSYIIKCPERLRRVERSKFMAQIVRKSQAQKWHLAFYFDKRQFTFWDAIFGIITTGFVCIVLCVASVFFANDADKLVVNPVETMISKVNTIRDNPLIAMKMADDEFRVEEIVRAKTQIYKADRFQMVKDKLLCSSKVPTSQPMETVILEKTIIRIGSLLALGFGEAGANIIEHNMSGVESAMVTAMVEGARVDCIIGATRIRDFGVATEVLKENIMTFVNQIAEIVHGVVDEFHGAANKNNGDTFLLVWRTSDLKEGYASKLADMSMMAFVKILGAVHRSPVLAHYRGHPGLQQRLGQHCRVNLTFALHYGWAIEGAVGSELKIDASYLSPHVSITETLELATQVYNVSIVLSEFVVTNCTAEMAAKCRLIDRVVVKGDKEPMQIYCIDLDFRSIMVDQSNIGPVNFTSRHRFRVRQFLEAEKCLKWHDDVDIVGYFNESPEVATMRFRYTLEFTHVFNMGYQNYSQGEWENAKRLLSLTKTMLVVEDGPSAALLQYMATPYKFEAPATWNGTRELCP